MWRPGLPSKCQSCRCKSQRQSPESPQQQAFAQAPPAAPQDQDEKCKVIDIAQYWHLWISNRIAEGTNDAKLKELGLIPCCKVQGPMGISTSPFGSQGIIIQCSLFWLVVPFHFCALRKKDPKTPDSWLVPLLCSVCVWMLSTQPYPWMRHCN